MPFVTVNCKGSLSCMNKLFPLKLCWAIKSVVEVPWTIWSHCSPWSFAEIWKVLYRFPELYDPFVLPEALLRYEKCCTGSWTIWSLCSPWSFAEIWKVLYRFPELYDPFVLPEALLRYEKCCTGSLNSMIPLFSLKLCWEMKSVLQVPWIIWSACSPWSFAGIKKSLVQFPWTVWSYSSPWSFAGIGKVIYRCMVTLFSLKLCWNMKSAVQV
jgi:hypothetical protein